MKNKIIIIIILLFTITGCTNVNNNAKNDKDIEVNKIKIITTSYPLMNLIQSIGGDKVEVSSIYKENENITNFQYSEDTISTINSNNFFVYLDDKFELKNLDLNKIDKSNKLEITNDKYFKNNLNNKYFDEDKNYNSSPYLLTSPKKAILISTVIYNNLIEKYPYDEVFFKKNYQKLINRLIKIDSLYWSITLEQEIPILVNHDVYYWLKEDYNLNIISIYNENYSNKITDKEYTEISKDINDNLITNIYIASSEINLDTANKLIYKEKLNKNEIKEYQTNLYSKDYYTLLDDNIKSLSLSMKKSTTN